MERISKVSAGLLIALVLVVMMSACTSQNADVSVATTTTTLVSPSSGPSAPEMHDDGLDSAIDELDELEG